MQIRCDFVGKFTYILSNNLLNRAFVAGRTGVFQKLHKEFFGSRFHALLHVAGRIVCCYFPYILQTYSRLTTRRHVSYHTLFTIVSGQLMGTVKVALVGMGTVGTGVARILTEQVNRVSRHSGKQVELARVVVQDLNKQRGCDLPRGVLTTDLSEITSDPEIEIVAQLIGGLEPARSVMLELLKSGKNLVTANKALLAEHGPQLFDRARQLGRSIAFEASVAGGIPIVTNIGQCLSANQITSLRGILNGTSNFILSQMEDNGLGYDDAVAEAQRRGYAEADPAMDVDGTDAVQKLAILAHLAFGARVHWYEIPRLGIEQIDTSDLIFARELGYRIKLLAVATLTDDGLELHVSPTLVRNGTPLAEVRGAYNAVSVVGDAVGRVFFHGIGAGQMPTASAVVADLIDMVVGRTAITFRTLELWSKRAARVVLRERDAIRSRYYLRLSVEDRPGVLADIAGVLGKNKISISSVIQHEPDKEAEESKVPLVIMTHLAASGALQSALSAFDKLQCVRDDCVTMQVLD